MIIRHVDKWAPLTYPKQFEINANASNVQLGADILQDNRLIAIHASCRDT